MTNARHIIGPMFAIAYRNHLGLVESCNAAAVAVAVERFRRARGELPETLDALSPEFMARVPDSIFNEGPFLFSRGEVCVTLDSWQYEKTHPQYAHGYQVASIINEKGRNPRWGACITVPLPGR